MEQKRKRPGARRSYKPLTDPKPAPAHGDMDGWSRAGAAYAAMWREAKRK